jgi:hypothetical protein
MGGTWRIYVVDKEGIKNVVDKPEWNRTLWRHKFKFEDNIKLNLNEIKCEDMDCIHVAQNSNKRRDLANRVMKPRTP